MPKNLTELTVRNARPGTARIEHRDGHTRGLVLRVTPRGVKSWAVVYRRRSDGRKRRYTIGNYPAVTLTEARDRAQQVLAAIARGDDPAGESQTRRTAITFARLAETWIQRHGRPNKSPRALHDDRLMLKNDILPLIGPMKADEVSKRDVIAVLDRVVDRGARVRSNRVLALLRAIYRWGLAEDLVTSDPTLGVRPRTIERPRDRVLTDEEVRAFWCSLEVAPMGASVRTILKLALLTGQRIGEIAGMAKTELSLSAGNPVWTQSGARRKNRELNRVPLSPMAENLIREALSRAGNGSYVFPSAKGDLPIGPHAATRALVRARPMLAMAHFRVHDLRRTVATGMASLGVNPHTISLVLDHISAIRGTVTGAVYVKYAFDREKREALETWERHLIQIVESSEPPLARGARITAVTIEAEGHLKGLPTNAN
jgi:integrase